MSELLRRLKNLKSQKSRFSEPDTIHLDNILISPVNEFSRPLSVKDFDQFDFYVNTGYDVYLLRLSQSMRKRISIYPADKTQSVVYIIVETDIDGRLPESVFSEVFKKLEESAGFPKLQSTRFDINL